MSNINTPLQAVGEPDRQEAFEKMLGPFTTASRRYVVSHQVSLVARQL